ncbi:cation:proton antiporter [Corynebacterium pelargi]|uniref:Glutathione-regulated potassium-efflux system protein KefC n=1 Tax=Corynebacterium pelargi TaxID=1471400 RepID=A0A410WA48_9CORY|nr:cation:proton antiporter [Corynebacterium pelargi]QAU52819.1 Glutathione-regulated potassium-efflux system protein KefC [Corynebacterium pelargi]GGG78981.1 potassium transporter Kef [Corynebacterium pelargi]
MTQDLSVTLLAEAGPESEPLVSFAWIMAVALLGPILSYATGKRIPAVVVLIAFGVLIGPHGLELASEAGGVHLVKEMGLGLLFLLAGFEINPNILRGREGKQGLVTWLICMVSSFIGAYAVLGFTRPTTAVVLAIAFTSTAVGTLLPIMKEQRMLDKPVGNSLMVHGAIGEIAPIIAMATLLSTRATWLTAAVLLAFFAVAFLVAAVPKTVHFFAPWMRRAMIHGAGSTNQTIVRMVMLLLGVLMAVAAVFELDVVLGAFAAGVILRQMVPEKFRTPLEQRLDVVGYGLLIPVFFVCSGMAIDPEAVKNNPWFLVLLIPLIYITRGVPILLRERFANTGSQIRGWRESFQLSFYAATALPIIVAVTDVAVTSKLLTAENASILVAAGSVTVLLFPLIGSLVKPAEDYDEEDPKERQEALEKEQA